MVHAPSILSTTRNNNTGKEGREGRLFYPPVYPPVWAPVKAWFDISQPYGSQLCESQGCVPIIAKKVVTKKIEIT